MRFYPSRARSSSYGSTLTIRALPTRFLLEMAKGTEAGSAVELAMPRHDIADYLGLTLETVSRMFAELKERGAIRLEGARRVHVLDRERLAAMSA